MSEDPIKDGLLDELQSVRRGTIDILAEDGAAIATLEQIRGTGLFEGRAAGTLPVFAVVRNDAGEEILRGPVGWEGDQGDAVVRFPTLHGARILPVDSTLRVQLDFFGS